RTAFGILILFAPVPTFHLCEIYSPSDRRLLFRKPLEAFRCLAISPLNRSAILKVLLPVFKRGAAMVFWLHLPFPWQPQSRGQWVPTHRISSRRMKRSRPARNS